MQKTQSFLWSAVVLATAGCSSLDAQIKSSGSMASGDTTYISTAYELAQLDDQAGKLVPTKAHDPRVIDVSSQLVTQADALAPQLTVALQSQGVTPPKQLPPDVQAEVAKLQSLQGPAFDQAYVADEIALHQKAMSVFQKENADTHNGMMRTQVEAELPAVTDDLNKLKSLAPTSS